MLGVAGLVGAGRSELGAALSAWIGLYPGRFGWSGGHCAGIAARGDEAGLGLSAGGSQLQGLMMQMSVLENSTLASLGRLQRSVSDPRAEARRARNRFTSASRLQSGLG